MKSIRLEESLELDLVCHLITFSQARCDYFICDFTGNFENVAYIDKTPLHVRCVAVKITKRYREKEIDLYS